MTDKRQRSAFFFQSQPLVMSHRRLCVVARWRMQAVISVSAFHHGGIEKSRTLRQDNEGERLNNSSFHEVNQN